MDNKKNMTGILEIIKHYGHIDSNLIKNFKAVIDVLEKEKSNTNIKGNLISSSFATSSMGISYKLKLDKAI